MIAIHPTDAELRRAYGGKRVFLTGHTGFKGGWLSLWLAELGAEVWGYALAPDTSPSLFEAATVASACHHQVADVRDLSSLREALRLARPDVVFHLAAQPLVRLSYDRPLDTLTTNVVGTAHLLEALRLEQIRCAVVVVTSDKCYENREWIHGYREAEPMGGHDVYSMSKGATELLVAAWRRSFFHPARLADHGVAIATARAGNVVGGGDWSRDRIVPDAVLALVAGRDISVRNPSAVRPWQHVLEPLGGYLLLGSNLMATNQPGRYCEGWNFGPRFEDARPVRDVVDSIVRHWGSGGWIDCHSPDAPHEAGLLRLSIDKAQANLGWSPRWHFDEAFERTVDWYKAFYSSTGPKDMKALCLDQIAAYMGATQGGAV